MSEDIKCQKTIVKTPISWYGSKTKSKCQKEAVICVRSDKRQLCLSHFNHWTRKMEKKNKKRISVNK